MPNNPFMVNQAGIGGDVKNMGMGMFAQGMQDRAQRKAEERAAQREEEVYRRQEQQMRRKQESVMAKEAAQQTLNQEAARMFETGDMDGLAQMMAEHPEMAQSINSVTTYKNEITQRGAVETAYKGLMGEGKGGSLIAAQTALIEANGGDPTETSEMLAMNKADREKEWKMTLMLNDRDLYDRVMESRGEQGKDQDTAGIRDYEYYKKLKKSDPEGAKAFGQERGYVTKEGRELSGHLQKRLSTASDAAIKAENNALKYGVLADDLAKADFSGGWFGGSWKEAYKDMTGSQDSVTELRKKYNGLRASRVVANLPPGSASDVDIALALSEFPSDNATAKEMSSFVRGISKIEQLDADFNIFKSEFISSKGTERGMLKAWKDDLAETAKKAKEAAKAAGEKIGGAAKTVGRSIKDLVTFYAG